jgi:hypothetical protein
MRAEIVRRALALPLLLLLAGASHANKGIWLTDTEIMALPMSGVAWDTLSWYARHSPAGDPSLSDQNSDNNVLMLAKALVYVREGRVEPDLRLAVPCGFRKF